MVIDFESMLDRSERIFSRKLLRYVRLMAWKVRLLSVCLSSVTLLHN